MCTHQTPFFNKLGPNTTMRFLKNPIHLHLKLSMISGCREKAYLYHLYSTGFRLAVMIMCLALKMRFSWQLKCRETVFKSVETLKKMLSKQKSVRTFVCTCVLHIALPQCCFLITGLFPYIFHHFQKQRNILKPIGV